MSKSLRNTIFTLTVLTLTWFSVNAAKRNQAALAPLSPDQPVLASAVQSNPRLPLKLSVAAPVINLGQTQQLTVVTAPLATLRLIGLNAAKQIIADQSFVARSDANGYYQARFKVADFHNLGIIKLTVMVNDHTESAQASTVYKVVAGTEPTTAAPSGSYLYPLIP